MPTVVVRLKFYRAVLMLSKIYETVKTVFIRRLLIYRELQFRREHTGSGGLLCEGRNLYINLLLAQNKCMRKTDLQPAAVRGKNPEDREERFKPPAVKEYR